MEEDFLEKLSLFFYLTKLERETLLASKKEVQFEKNETIYEASSRNELQNLYLLVSEQVSIIDTKGEEIETIMAPLYFGEQAVFFDELRFDTVISLTKTNCVLLDGQLIKKIIKKCHVSLGIWFVTKK